MIDKISLQSFKAFEHTEVDLSPMTIILGPNNSGKSSLISPIKMLSQTIDSYDNKVPLLLNGSLGDFGTFRDVVYDNETRRHMVIELSFAIEDTTRYGKPNFDEYGIELTYNYRKQRKEITIRSLSINVEDREILNTEYYKGSERQLVQSIGSKEVPSQLKATISDRLRIRNFIPRLWFVKDEVEEGSSLYEFLDEEMERQMSLAEEASIYLRNELAGVEYVGAMRQPPSRTYLSSGEKRQRVGPRGGNAINILAMDSRRGGAKSQELLDRVSNWLRRAEMGEEVQIESISDRHYEVRIKHPKTSESQNFADTGYGHSQVLPVLVAGMNLREGGTLMVEQPEIHLHPKAQSELGDYFIELYNSNKNAIVETHSEHMVLRLQRRVAEGKIDPEEISFYYVYPTEQEKRVKKMNLDSRAKFVDDWPEGFFPERLHEAEKLSEARYS